MDFSLNNMKNTFVNKRILITGISGFVGSHLARKLNILGAEVFGISRSHKGSNIFNGDITDRNFVEKIINKNNITMCFHLAAESLVESGQKDPYATFSTNIMGTLSILELSRIYNLDRIIIASTSHVYGDNKLPFKEDYFPRPSRPYETSKTCVDLIAQSYADTFGLPVLIPRFTNIYGPADYNYHRLIPKTIKRVLAGESPTMWGGTAIRDFIYIDDAIDAYIKMATVSVTSIEKNRIYNFGTGKQYSVRDVIQTIITQSGSNVTVTKIADAREDEIKAQYVSTAKAKRILNWKPKVSFDNGIKKTIDWYKKNC